MPIEYKKGRAFRVLRGTVFSIACLSLSPMAAAQNSPEDLVFAIVPQQSASRLAKIWVPLLKAVSAQAGITLRFSTTKDIPTFEACLSAGAYDVAYMNPYHYSVFHDASQYQAFARQKGKRLKGLVVVRSESQISDLTGLDGRTVAFPSPAAFGASVVPRAEIKARGLTITARYVKSHDSVYRAVSAGLITAGGGVSRTFNTLDAQTQAQLKIIHTTEDYTPHAFAARADVAVSTVAQLYNAMETVAQSQPNLLKPLGMAGFERGHDADWDDVRSLNIKPDHSLVNTAQAETCPFD